MIFLLPSSAQRQQGSFFLLESIHPYFLSKKGLKFWGLRKDYPQERRKLLIFHAHRCRDDMMIWRNIEVERREVGSTNVIQLLTLQTPRSEKQMLREMEEQFAEAAAENVVGHPSDE